MIDKTFLHIHLDRIITWRIRFKGSHFWCWSARAVAGELARSQHFFFVFICDFIFYSCGSHCAPFFSAPQTLIVAISSHLKVKKRKRNADMQHSEQKKYIHMLTIFFMSLTYGIGRTAIHACVVSVCVGAQWRPRRHAHTGRCRWRRELVSGSWHIKTQAHVNACTNTH